MKPSILLDENREAIRAAAERNRTANPRVFGSVLWGEDREDSDLDILVDDLPGATFFDVCGLQGELRDLLGIPVDVLTPGDLQEKWRDRVVAEAIPV